MIQYFLFKFQVCPYLQIFTWILSANRFNTKFEALSKYIILLLLLFFLRNKSKQDYFCNLLTKGRLWSLDTFWAKRKRQICMLANPVCPCENIYGWEHPTISACYRFRHETICRFKGLVPEFIIEWHPLPKFPINAYKSFRDGGKKINSVGSNLAPYSEYSFSYIKLHEANAQKLKARVSSNIKCWSIQQTGGIFLKKSWIIEQMNLYMQLQSSIICSKKSCCHHQQSSRMLPFTYLAPSRPPSQ